MTSEAVRDCRKGDEDRYRNAANSLGVVGRSCTPESRLGREPLALQIHTHT